MSVAAVILAAGSSRRMGRPKALLRVGTTTFLGRIAALAREGGLDPVVVVVGEDAAAIAAAHPELAGHTVRNLHPELGPLSSLRLGLAALPPGVEGAVVFPVDHPLVSIETVRAMAERFARSDAAVVVPTSNGRRGHPTLFSRAVFAELEAAPLAEGARAVVRADPGRVAELEVDDPGILANVDTPDAYLSLVGDEPGR